MNSIDSISIEHHGNTYKKLLYMSVLDNISQIISPKSPHRKRILLFLNKYSNWEHGRYVSLPHLYSSLKKNI